jgi:hypothetical protein
VLKEGEFPQEAFDGIDVVRKNARAAHAAAQDALR